MFLGRISPRFLSEGFGTCVLIGLMGSEDFAFYQQKLPGVFIFLGAGNAKKNLPMHNPGYDVIEESMIIGAALHVQVALNYLDNSYK